MAEEVKLEMLTAEATALQLAFNLLIRGFPTSSTGPNRTEVSQLFRDVNNENPDEVKARLREMADLIGDLKNRMLK